MCVLLLLTACGRNEEPLQSNKVWEIFQFHVINTEDLLQAINRKLPEMNMETIENSDKVETTEPFYDILYCSDWQLAYLDKLNEFQKDNMSDPEPIECNSYYLYDIDHNGVPELILEWGGDDAHRYWEIYTYQDDELISMGETPGSHTSIYIYPPDQTVVLVYSQGDMWKVDQVTIEEEKIVRKRVDESDPYDRNYKHDFKSYEEISGYNLEIVLPILEYDEDTKNDILYRETVDKEEIRQALEETLENKREICIIYPKINTFFNKDERTIQFCTLDEKLKKDRFVSRVAWVDFNRDGIEECLVDIDQQEGNYAILILSYQDGTVYGYYLYDIIYWAVDGDNYYNNGIMYKEYGESDGLYYDIHFYKEQVYRSHFYDLDSLGKKVEWETYEP